MGNTASSKWNFTYFPPSEKLSGVMFKTPIIFGKVLKFKFLNFFFFVIRLISFFTIFFNRCSKSLIFLIDNFFIDFLEIISISSKEIRLFPFNGKDFAFLIKAFD